MNMTKRLIFAMLYFFCSIAWAGDNYGPVPELFFNEFSKRNFAESIDVLLSNQDVKVSPGATDQQLRQNFTSTVNTLGDFEYKELVYKKEVGTRFVILKYIIGMAKKPIMFRLSLYKPQDRWLVKGFNFDSDFEKATNDLISERL